MKNIRYHDIEKKEHIFEKMSMFDHFDLHILNTAESVLMAIFPSKTTNNQTLKMIISILHNNNNNMEAKRVLTYEIYGKA